MRRKPADDAMFDFKPERVPKIPPLKVCKECAEGIKARREQLTSLIEMAKQAGVNDVIGMDFVQSIVMDHDDMLLMTLTAFIAAVAQRKFKKPIRAASKLILNILIGSHYTLERVEKAITGLVPEMQCQWHHQGPMDEGMDDEYQGDDGPVPPNGDGPSMFG